MKKRKKGIGFCATRVKSSRSFFTGSTGCKEKDVAQAFSPAPPPNDPENEDSEEKKEGEFKISKDDAPHIFDKREGHLPDTPENRKLLLDLVSNIKHFLGEFGNGNKCYAKFLSNGKQLWAYVRGRLIRNGGLNDVPIEFHPETGLNRPFPPNFKPKF